MKDIKDNLFKGEVLDSEIAVVVDFWAPWCGPCRMVAPIMEELDKQFSEKVKFVKVNIDENPNTLREYGVSSIPTVMVFKDGSPVESIVGFRPKNDFEDVITKYL